MNLIFIREALVCLTDRRRNDKIQYNQCKGRWTDGFHDARRLASHQKIIELEARKARNQASKATSSSLRKQLQTVNHDAS